MEYNRIKKWGNSKVVRVNDYEVEEKVFILSKDEYNELVLNNNII